MVIISRATTHNCIIGHWWTIWCSRLVDEPMFCQHWVYSHMCSYLVRQKVAGVHLFDDLNDLLLIRPFNTSSSNSSCSLLRLWKYVTIARSWSKGSCVATNCSSFSTLVRGRDCSRRWSSTSDTHTGVYWRMSSLRTSNIGSCRPLLIWFVDILDCIKKKLL